MYSFAITLYFAALVSAVAVDRRAAFTLQNGQDAQALNAKFATLTADSPCTAGQTVCLNGGVSQCVDGKLSAPIMCAGGLTCMALPLVNSAGTSVTCDTAADAAARIATTGATGGVAARAFGRGALGRRAGTQFITGACTSDADCASGCCGFNSGKCAGVVIALTRDGGCGHGDAQSNNNAAVAQGFSGLDAVKNFKPSGGGAAAAAPAAANAAAAAPAAAGGASPRGTQFITGACAVDSDCASGCCGFNSGKCAGNVIALTRDGGCGHGATPNNNAAIADGLGNLDPVKNFKPSA